MQKAGELEAEGKLREAEKMLCTVKEYDAAIKLYRQREMHDHVIRLVAQYRKVSKLSAPASSGHYAPERSTPIPFSCPLRAQICHALDRFPCKGRGTMLLEEGLMHWHQNTVQLAGHRTLKGRHALRPKNAMH